MRKVHAENVIACSADAFWKLFVDRAFNEALYRDGLSFQRFEIVEMSETSRHVRCTPNVAAPGPLRKLLGDRFSYEEKGKLDPSGTIWRWEVTPSTLQKKISNTGSIRAEDLGDGRCTRIDEMQVEARVFGLGSLIERATEDEVTDAWKKTAAFMNDWIERHGAG